jgi:hypothetical protein
MSFIGDEFSDTHPSHNIRPTNVLTLPCILCVHPGGNHVTSRFSANVKAEFPGIKSTDPDKAEMLPLHGAHSFGRAESWTKFDGTNSKDNSTRNNEEFQS